MSEEKLNQEFEKYRELAKQDKQIDLASLAINALQSQQANLLPDKQKRMAYFVSLVFPPFGLLFAVKFYLSGKDDGVQTAWICATLTAVAILLAVLFAKILFSGSGLDVNQLQQIDPKSIQDLVQ